MGNGVPCCVGDVSAMWRSGGDGDINGPKASDLYLPPMRIPQTRPYSLLRGRSVQGNLDDVVATSGPVPIADALLLTFLQTLSTDTPQQCS